MLIRELLTRYGRNNIGFLWLFVEPAAFIIIVTVVWSKIRGVHLTDIPIAAFALTGYSSLLLWRNTVSRCIGAVKSNSSLLFHRQVTVVDIFTARIILELISITSVLIMLALALWAVDWVALPENIMQVMGGWFLLCWFAAALGMTIGGLAEKIEVVGRLWPPLSYILMAVSGVAFTVNALPPAAQDVILWIPMINALEYIREGWFGSAMHAHYDLGYLTIVNVVLSLIGFSLVRQVGTTGGNAGEE
jgi:ABC-2 type transport system permease protein/capsular polysaccharide transport system permease protein